MGGSADRIASGPLTDSEKEAVEAHRQSKILPLVAKESDSSDIPAKGNMGLKGLLATLSNATSMMVLAGVAVFWTVYQAPNMHREGIRILRELYDAERGEQRRVLEQLGRTMDANTSAVKELTTEVRWLGKKN